MVKETSEELLFLISFATARQFLSRTPNGRSTILKLTVRYGYHGAWTRVYRDN